MNAKATLERGCAVKKKNQISILIKYTNLSPDILHVFKLYGRYVCVYVECGMWHTHDGDFSEMNVSESMVWRWWTKRDTDREIEAEIDRARESLEKKAVANYLEGLHRETGNQGRSVT